MMVRCDLASFYALQIGDEFSHPETGETMTVQDHATAEIEEEGIRASGFFLRVAIEPADK